MSTFSFPSDGHIHNESYPLNLGSSQAVGGGLVYRYVDTGVVSLTTSGATTVITLDIPVGAVILGVAANVTTAVAGVSASGVTATLAFTGGSTLAIGTFVSAGDGNVAKNTKITLAYNPASSSTVVSSSVANAALVFSGGADNTPSAGAIRVVVQYLTMTPLVSVA